MRFLNRSARLLAGCVLATAGPLAAQEADEASLPPEREIVVLGSPLPLPPGTPAYGSVTITRERLTDEASGRLENVLRDVAGFQQFRRSDSRSANPTAQGVTLRGIGGNASSRTLVLLDGVPQADPFFGHIPFNALVPERLSVVRVTRGGGSGAFGAGAVAGTIELASATRADLPPASLSAFGGSFGSTELSAIVAPDVGDGFVTLAGRWDRSIGTFTTPDDQRVPASARAAYDSVSGSLRGVAPVGGDGELQATLSLLRDRRTLRFDGADSFQDATDASVRYLARGPWQVDALAYVQLRDFGNRVISSTSFRLTLDQRETPSTGVGGKIELRPPVGENQLLRIGADFRIAEGRLFETAFNGGTGAVSAERTAGGRTSVFGGFAEYDRTFGPVVLTGGARADRWRIADGFFTARDAVGTVTQDSDYAERADWEVTGRIGLVASVGDGLALRVAGYTGTRLPTLNELYRPFVVFPVTTEANAALRPERLKGVEAGFDLMPAEGFALAVTGYWNRLDDAIANVTLAPSLRRRQNVAAIEAKGIEATASARLGRFDLSASYAYIDSGVVGEGASAALDGKRPAQTPEHAASGTLGWRPTDTLGGSVTLRHVGAQYEDDLEDDRLPPALTVDATAELRLSEQLALVGRVENLFDEQVLTRRVIDGPNESTDLGTPQTFWLGVRARLR